MSRVALAAIAAPTTVLAYTAAQDCRQLLSKVRAGLSKTAASTDAVALFATNDSSVGSGTLARSDSVPAGCRPLISLDGVTPGGTLKNIADEELASYIVVARILGTAALDVLLSGDPETGTSIGPNVDATNTSNQSIPESTVTVVTGWTAVTNGLAGFVAATGLFTAPTAGFYDIDAQLQYTAASAILGAVFRASIAVNGTIIATGQEINTVASTSLIRTPKVSKKIELAAGDVVSIRGYQSSGGAVTLVASGVTNFLSITQLNIN